MKVGHTQTDIADILDVDKSTISRELKRNKGKRGYQPKQAHERYLEQRNLKIKPRILNST